MSTIHQTPEKKFVDHLVHLLQMEATMFTLAYLDHLSIQEINGKKELVFQEGCIIEPIFRPMLKELWRSALKKRVLNNPHEVT